MAGFLVECVGEAFEALAPFAGCVSVATVDCVGSQGYGEVCLCVSVLDGEDGFGRWDSVRRYFVSTWAYDEGRKVFTGPK